MGPSQRVTAPDELTVHWNRGHQFRGTILFAMDSGLGNRTGPFRDAVPGAYHVEKPQLRSIPGLGWLVSLLVLFLTVAPYIGAGGS